MAERRARAEGAEDAAAEDDTGLPAGVAAAWGLRARPTKGPARGLSVEQVVAAAIGVAREEGLAEVSMSRVAAELGVSAMALYRYVSAKDELLVLMADAAYGLPPEGPAPEEGWRAGLAHWARAQRAVLHRNLWTLRLPVSTPPATPHSVAWMEQGLRCLRGTGLDAGEKLGVMSLVGGYVRSEAMLMRDIEAAARASGRTLEQATAAYGRLLARLADARRFPEVAAVAAAGVLEAPEPDAGPQDPDADFEFGLTRVLDGIEVLIRSRPAPAPGQAPTPAP